MDQNKMHYGRISFNLQLGTLSYAFGTVRGNKRSLIVYYGHYGLDKPMQTVQEEASIKETHNLLVP
jgi:hypothetical protein